jgi:predicted phosphodiesterase
VRILILSDIHANIEALDSVLDDARGQFDRIVCCGDLVGYNPDPALVVDWARDNCEHVVRGNHDKVVAGIDDLEWFNPTAQTSARWTQQQLSSDQLQYLRELAQGPMALAGFQIFHGAPFDEDEYLLSADLAAQSFSMLELPLSFFGHSHLQGAFFQKRRNIGIVRQVKAGERETVIELEADTSYLINPGSVGQPRDGDPRAAYALYEAEERLVRLRRVEYPIARTAEKIKSAGLPDTLGLRLFQGQ